MIAEWSMAHDKNEKSIRNKNFDPEKYGMVVCPGCDDNGYVQKNPKRQCCPKSGGFGFIVKGGLLRQTSETNEDLTSK